MSGIGTSLGTYSPKKNQIKARLNGMQRAMAIRPSSSLVELENKLFQELDNVLKQEHKL